MVIDGLRPAAIEASTTPYLATLAREGCSYGRAVAAFPALTRANAATLATGSLPGRTGILGNEVWHHELGHIDTGKAGDVRRLRGVGAMPQASIAEKLSRSGRSTVVIGNGSAGCTYLLNPGSDDGHGTRIASVGPDNEAYRNVPEEVLAGIERLGTRPTSEDEALEWAAAAGVVSIATQAPDLLIFWSGQPDTAHHTTGLSSTASAEAIRRADQAVRTLHAAALDSGRDCNLIVTADHGFCATLGSVEVTDTLQRIAEHAGLPPDGFIPTFNCGAVFGYFTPETPESLRALVVEQIVNESWAGPVFCADTYCPDSAFPMSLAVTENSPFVPDLIITMYADPADPTGPTDPPARAFHGRAAGTAASSGVHGTVHPADMRIPLILHGPAFTPRTCRSEPAGPADVAATVYTLITGEPLEDTDGRVLTESLRAMTEDPALPADERIIRRGEASLSVSRIRNRSYLIGGTSDQPATVRHSPVEHEPALAAAPGRPTTTANEE